MATRDGKPKHDEALRDRVKALWGLGKSAREIADEIGTLSRGAVLGLVHRMELPPRETAAAVRRSVPSAPRPARAQPVKPSTVVIAAPRVALKPLALSDHDPARPCQWPCGAGETAAICGRPRDPDDWKSRYCAAHRAASARSGQGVKVTLRVRIAPDPLRARVAGPYLFTGGRS